MLPVNRSQLHGTKNGSDVCDCLSRQPRGPRDGLRPFVHKFQTSRKSYLLDVNTNRILCVDPATWEIVEDVGVLSVEETVQKHSGTLPADEVASAYEGIVHAQTQDGLLLPWRGPLAAPPDIKTVQEALDSERRNLLLWVTEDCNFRCDYCMYGGEYRGRRGHTHRSMSWEVARRAIDEFIEHSHNCRQGKKKGWRTISFWGGEPLLNLDLIRQCMEYARAKLNDKVYFHVTTNGSLLKGDAAAFLASQNAGIQVSLDGPSHIHDYRRHHASGAETWAEVVRNLREFLDKYPQYNGANPDVIPISLSATLSPLLNALEVDDFFASQIGSLMHLHRFGMVVCKMAPVGSEYLESLAPEDRGIPGLATLRQRFLENALKGVFDRDPGDSRWVFQRSLFERPFMMFLRRPMAPPNTWLNGPSGLGTMCIPGHSHCIVDVDGYYYPCQRTPNTEAFVIGHVERGIDPWRSYHLKRQYDALGADACEQCWCVNFCHIGCVAYVRDGPTISAEAKQRACCQYREETHRLLTELYDVLEVNPHAFDYLKTIAYEATEPETHYTQVATSRPV